VYVFCLLDRRKMELTRIWIVPSAIFYKRAYRTLLPKGMIQFNFDCRTAGEDRWDAYEVTRAEIGPRLVKLIRSAARRRVRFKREALTGRWLELAA
jgi:hypothetical protein